MALTTFPGGIHLPARVAALGGPNLSYTNFLLDAASEKAACVIQAPKTGTISKIGWRTGTVTTGAILDVRMETITATTGAPSGALLGANTNALQTVLDADDDTWFLTTLTLGAAVQKGDIFAIVIENPVVSFGNLNVSHLANHSDPGFPYCLHFTASWAKFQNNPVLAIEYNDGSYEIAIGCMPFSSLPSVSVDSDTSPDEIGVKFSLNYNATCTGFWMSTEINVDMFATLYDSGGNVLLQRQIDDDVQGVTGAGYAVYLFDSTTLLSGNQVYRLAFAPRASIANKLEALVGKAPNASVMDAIEGSGSFHWTERTNEGAWTDDTLALPYFGPILSQIDVA